MIHPNQLNDATIMANLSCFRSAAHHLSFTRAATELGLTQGAVSHRIKKLEQLLGFQLFLRFNRRLQLTQEGEQLLQVVNQSLLSLEQTVRSLRAKELSIEVNLSLPPSLALGWFSRKLADFQQQYPQIRLNIETHSRLIDFSREGVDLAIYYGQGDYPGLEVYPLGEELITPVCSPDYAEAKQLQQQPENLQQCYLLHDSHAWPHAGRFAEWESWSNETATPINLRQSYCFDQSVLCLQAAQQGAGVAMGRALLIQPALAQGTLVAPFAEQACLSGRYDLVCHPNRRGHPAIQATINWLQTHFTNDLGHRVPQNGSDTDPVSPPDV